MPPLPVTFEQMQQFRAEVDGRIAAAQAESAASLQAAAQANRDDISKAVEGKFATVDEKSCALSGCVMELFGEQKDRMDVTANKVLEGEKTLTRGSRT